jgi:hypothetical protein
MEGMQGGYKTASLPKGKKLPARQRGGWMGVRVSLDVLGGKKKLFFLMGIEPRNFRHYADRTKLNSFVKSEIKKG